MSELRQALEEYLALRMKLGFKLKDVGKALRDFLAFLESKGASHITRDLALHWAQQPAESQPATWARRLGLVRCFAAWRSVTDPRTEVPPKGLIPNRACRMRPYIYSDKEIQQIIQRARQLPSSTGLRGGTYSTLFGLLAVTGLRVSEALSLNREDVDLDEGVLTVRWTKFGKSRLVPVHETTLEVLANYTRTRNCIFPRPTTPSFLLSERGVRVKRWAAEYNFAKVSREVGLRAPAKPYRHGHGPRLHDMRHRFAVLTLIDWYRAGVDVEREIPKLATYLGHAHMHTTYWYIEGVPELLELATQRIVERGKEAKQ